MIGRGDDLEETKIYRGGRIDGLSLGPNSNGSSRMEALSAACCVHGTSVWCIATIWGYSGCTESACGNPVWFDQQKETRTTAPAAMKMGVKRTATKAPAVMRTPVKQL